MGRSARWTRRGARRGICGVGIGIFCELMGVFELEMLASLGVVYDL